MRLRLAALLVLPCLLAACGSDGTAEVPVPPSSWEGVTRTQGLRVTWEGPESGLPLNAEFPVTVRVADAAGNALEGATVEFQAEMPGHGHGMLRQPRSTEVGGGVHRVEGVLLHMEGAWVVHVDVIAGGVADRASFEVDVQ